MTETATVGTETRKLDLEWLSRTAGRAAEAFGVPGVQVAVVQGGQVLFAGGFGRRDNERDLPVTEHSVFAHGSTGKSYTALLVGALVDEGLLTWDTKVRDIVPEFRLGDPYTTDHVSVRDILSHRWGMPRHDFVHIAYPDLDRAEFVRRLRHLDLSRELREQFQYCNFGYLLAGHIIGLLTGSTYEEQLRRRVLEPLGMTDTVAGTATIESVEDRAVAHDEKDGEIQRIPYRGMANMVPAGGLFSSALDATRYLLCQLGGGEVDGTRVVSKASLDETWSVQTPLGGPERAIMEKTPGRIYGYGMGWMVGTFHGHRYISHGGGIDGFTTEFALLPDDGIGVAVCGNRATGLPNALSWEILEQLLGVEGRDWTGFVKTQIDEALAATKDAQAPKAKVPGKPPAHDLEDYAGRYEHPGYGEFEVSIGEGGELAVRWGVVSFTTEHRQYETWALAFAELGGIKFELNFITDGSGEVAEATVNFESSLPPVRLRRAPDASASSEAVLEGLAGRYSLGPVTVEVKVEAGQKLVAYQNGVRVDLVPAGKHRYTVPAAPGLTLDFVVGDDGRATAIATPQGTLTRSD